MSDVENDPMSNILTSILTVVCKKPPVSRSICKMGSRTLSYLQFEQNESKSAFRVKVPGWSLEDINIIAKDLTQAHYLRTSRVFNKWEQLREIAKSSGFLDICILEETHGTYMRCVDLERTIPHKDLLDLGRKPYAYDLEFESRIGKIGKTSFQIANKVHHVASGTELYRGTLMYVAVDYKTKRPQPLPTWWSEKFINESRSSEIRSLKIDNRKPKGDEIILHRSEFQVRSSEVDRFGHTNNTALNSMCLDALLDTFSRKKVMAVPSVECFESSIKRMEVDFIGSCGAGDVLSAVVCLDTAKERTVICKLYKDDMLLFVLSQEYEIDIHKYATSAKI